MKRERGEGGAGEEVTPRRARLVGDSVVRASLLPSPPQRRALHPSPSFLPLQTHQRDLVQADGARQVAPARRGRRGRAVPGRAGRAGRAASFCRRFRPRGGRPGGRQRGDGPPRGGRRWGWGWSSCRNRHGRAGGGHGGPGAGRGGRLAHIGGGERCRGGGASSQRAGKGLAKGGEGPLPVPRTAHACVRHQPGKAAVAGAEGNGERGGGQAGAGKNALRHARGRSFFFGCAPAPLWPRAHSPARHASRSSHPGPHHRTRTRPPRPSHRWRGVVVHGSKVCAACCEEKKKRRTRGARRGGRGTRCLKNRKARTRAGWLTGAPRTAPRTRAGGGRGRWAGGYSVTGWRACGGGVREHVMGAGAVGKRSEQRRWRRVEPAHSLEKSRRVQLPARAPPAPPHAGAHQRAAGPWWRRRHHRPPPPPPPSPHQAHPLRRPPRPRAGRERGPALLAVRWADGRRCVCGGEGRIRGAWCGKMGGQAWAHARALGWTPRWGAGRARSPGGRGEKKASTHTHARPRAMQRSPTLALSPLSPPQAPTGSPPSAPSSSSPRPAPSSSP